MQDAAVSRSSGSDLTGQGSQIAGSAHPAAAPSAGTQYSDRVQCTSCNGTGSTGEHGCTDCFGKGLDHAAFVGGIEQALNDAYAEGRKDEADALKDAAKELRGAMGISQDFSDWPIATLMQRAATRFRQIGESRSAPPLGLGLVERLRNGGQSDLADMAEKLEQALMEPRKLWLWKNFVDGRQEYWAFDNLYPIHMDNGDPQTLGEPRGYAIFKPSRDGSNGRTK